MASKLFILPALLFCLGCGSSVSRKALYDPENPLPDLFIRKVNYQSLGPSNRIQARLTSLIVTYEFRVQIENAGNASFGREFYLSFTTNMDDYSSNIYSRHELLNESGHVINPGQSFTFLITADIEFPRTRIPAFFPIRFFINTEGTGTNVGTNVIRVPEHDYRNNTFELSMRVSLRI